MPSLLKNFENSAVDLADQTQKQARKPDQSFWVTASAGSGKTKMLCDRVVSLLCHGADPRSIVCLTYTKAAATEMRQRVLAILEKIAHQDPAYLDFYNILLQRGVDPVGFCLTLIDNQYHLYFQTIHAFCERILRRFPLEANVPPDFTVLEETGAAALLTQAAESFYDLDDMQGDETTAVSLAKYLHEEQYRTVLGPLIGKRHRLYQAVVMPEEAFRENLRRQLGLSPSTETMETLAAAFKQSLPDNGLKQLASLLQNSSNENDQKKGDFFDSWTSLPHPQRDFAAYVDFFLTKEDTIRKSFATQKARLDPDDLVVLSNEALRLYTAKQHFYTMECIEATCALRSVATAVWSSYITEKETARALDFDDLLDAAHRLLQEHNAWVQYKLEQSIQHLLIDEAQDTNPHQWTLIKALLEDTLSGASENPKTLLVVGDYKQSIYRFQDADPDAYLAEYGALKQQYYSADAPLIPLILNTSFRTTSHILTLVDDLFNTTSCGKGVRQTEPLKHHPARSEGGICILHPKIITDTESAQQETFYIPTHHKKNLSPTETVANKIAQTIEEILKSCIALPSRQGQSVTANDIWILLQKRGELQKALLSSLNQRDIPVAGGDRIWLREHLATQDLCALLLFMICPDDDLTLACLLKSPIYQIDEQTLFIISHNRNDTLWTSLYHHVHQKESEKEDGLQKAYTSLQHLLNHADIWTPHQTITHILYEQGGYTAFRRAFGEEVDEILHLFMDYTLRFESENLPSLSGFLPWFEQHATSVKRETLGRGVRIQTIHGSKGLEAPIVILADTNHRPINKSIPIVWLDSGFLWVLPKRTLHSLNPLREAAKKEQTDEYHRLLYVAMTRAEDALHMFGSAKKTKPPKEGKSATKKDDEAENPSWYDALLEIMEKKGTLFRDPTGETGYTIGHLPQNISIAKQTIEKKQQPLWIDDPVKKNNEQEDHNKKNDEKQKSKTNNESITLGIAIHTGIQYCLAKTALTQQDLLNALLPLYAPELSQTAAERAWLAFQSPNLQQQVTQAQRIETEVSLLHKGEALRLDAVFIFEHHITIVDFKSGNATHHADSIQKQMQKYQTALQDLYPNKTIQTHVIFV